MASKQKKKSISINQYKNKRELNIGIIIFALIFIYLIITVVMYATRDKISIYEVREGSILRDTSYTGLILREEELVNSESSGYINYFQGTQNKVKTGMNICAVSPSELTLTTNEEETAQALSKEEESQLLLQTQNFSENFDPQKFSAVYNLKSEIGDRLQSAADQTRTAQLNTLVSESGGTIRVYSSSRDGILVRTYDGYEDVSLDSFTEEHFDRSQYKSTNMEDNMEIQSGEPMYKLITSESWSAVIPLDDAVAKEMAETTSVKVRIDQDSETMWADFSILKKDKKFYGCLSFNESMVRYADERYLNIDLILEDESGLKIPKTSVTQKECYAVPQDYLTTSGDSSDIGVMVQDNDSGKFQQVQVYTVKEDGTAYLNPSDIRQGSILVKPESSETMSLTGTTEIQGVYCVNQGYAVFKPVTILCESDDYYIVQAGNSYELTNYDRIVQDGGSVKEDEVVFQ